MKGYNIKKLAVCFYYTCLVLLLLEAEFRGLCCVNSNGVGGTYASSPFL